MSRDAHHALAILVTSELLLARVTSGPLSWSDMMLSVVGWQLGAYLLDRLLPAHPRWTLALLPCIAIQTHIAAYPVHQALGAWSALGATALLLLGLLWVQGRLTLPTSVTVALCGATFVACIAGGTSSGVGLWFALVLVQRLHSRIPWLLLPLALWPAPFASSADTRPDILLITVDALRADDPLDIVPPATPRLATTAWAPAPWTLPSLASLWTGRPPHEHRAGRGRGDTFVPLGGLPTLPQDLSSAGYTTVALSEGNVFTGRGFGLLDGFSDAHHPWAPAESPLPRARAPHGKARPLLARLWPVAPTDVLEAVPGALARPGPTFVWTHLMGVHLPFHESSCRPEVLTAPATRQAILTDPWWSTPEGAACFQHAHRAAASHVAAGIRSLLQRIDLSKTAVFVTADHGEALGPVSFEHGHTLAPEVTRVPLLLTGAISLPEAIERPVDLLDVGATIRAIAGATPRGVGRDLRHPLDRRAIQLGSPLYLEHARGVVSGDWLLREEEGITTIEPVQPTDQTTPPDLTDVLPPRMLRTEGHPPDQSQDRLRVLGYVD